MPFDTLLAARIARGLEAGAYDGALAGMASRAWAGVAASRVVRSLRADPSRVITIGGATLGGSGKTPLAIACAAALAKRGIGAVLVGHAYRAAVEDACEVRAYDDVKRVGDEAIVAARALADTKAIVVVGPSRQRALHLAMAHEGFAILDGVAQLASSRARLALLALDAEEPWGSAHCPPRGDLKAPRSALLHAADHVVAIADPLARPFFADRPIEPREVTHRDHAHRPVARPLHIAHIVTRGASHHGDLVDWSTLASLRVGLVTSLARPHRVTSFLARRGIIPHLILSSLDHTPPNAALRKRVDSARVDLWLATPKCALHLPPHLPVAVLEHSLELPSSLLAHFPTKCESS